MTESATFPTFCHISEYNESGYEILHRMMAMSQPLILWGPTGFQLEHKQCRIPPRVFIRYVEEGRIRVFGREQWLTSRAFRDNHPFPGAKWAESFDGELKRICEEDVSRPLQQRRVVAAPPEGGWQWAEEYLAANPNQVTRWNRLARSKAATSKVPAGTLQAAFKYAEGDPFRLAQAILRDAYNHGQAIRLSGAEVPFLLTATDRRFLDVLGKTADPGDPASRSRSGRGRAVQARLPESPSVDETSAELAAQLLKILEQFDLGSPGTRHHRNLDEFLSGSGHQELVTWLSRMSGRLKQTDARNLDNAIINALREDIGRAEFAKPLREMIRQPATTAVGAIGLATTVIGYALDPVGTLSIAGLFAAAFPVAKVLFQSLGYVPASFTGPQWPFLYTAGSPATKRQLAHLLTVLSEA
jgi:hypothetical protein